MPSQKLKKISLGIVLVLVLVVLLWFVSNVWPLRIAWGPHLIWPWETIGIAGVALIIILGLSLVAKILIEIFK